MSGALCAWARGLAALTLLCGGCGAVKPLPAPPGRATACRDESAVDVLHHDIALSLQLQPPALAGRGEVRIKTRRATDTVVLHAKLQVRAVTTDAGPLRFHLENGLLCVELPQRLPAGVELGLKMVWDVRTDGAMPKFSPEQVWAGYNAAAWMPTRQDPAQRATLALRISAPAELKVAASGRALAPQVMPLGMTMHSFVLDQPSPPFLYAFAAGRFQEAMLDVDGLRLRALGPVGAELDAALAVTAQAQRFYSERLRYRLPLPVYTQVFVAGDAAQEAAGMAILAASFLKDLRQDPSEDWVFAHELGHQWFAWLLPCADFADFWLNEGFATFLVAAVKEQRWGQSAGDREVRLWRARSDRVHREGRDRPLSTSAPGMTSMSPPTESQLPSRGVTYARGALALHRLRRELGDGPFWNGVRLYVKDYAGRSVRSEDLRRAMEAGSGVDLRAFFARWVYQAAPDL